MKQTPFTIDIPKSVLDDLQGRLVNTNWPNETQSKGWDKGPELAYMKELTTYWAEKYDWKKVEQELNGFSHFKANLEGMDVHYIHEKSKHENAIPIVLIHGWADSFYRYIHLIEPLTTAKAGIAFDVIVPSLPGFAFSGQPEEGKMTAELAAETIAQLMEGLGYDKYMVHGGDWGSTVAQEVARAHTDRVIGLHLTDVPFANIYMVDEAQASEAEKKYLKEIETWGTTENGYVSIQSTKPLMLSYGLSDSPVGLASWLIQHFHYLSEAMPSKKDLLTNVMLYWLTDTIRSSIRYYNEGMGGDWSAESGDSAESWTEDTGGKEEGKETDQWGQSGSAAPDTSAASAESWGGGDDAAAWSTKIDVPTAIALFPKDIGCPPREFAERFFDITRFTKMKHGGHFAALEVPELVEGDIRTFAATLSKNK